MLQQTPELPAVPPSDLLSDEPPLETYRHLVQILLLLSCLEWWWQDRNDFFAAGNLSIYYNTEQLRKKDFRGPDFFVVLNTERKERKSWVVWEEEGKYPNLIVEILSQSTASVDRGLKKQLYQDTFRTPEYFLFDPYSLEFIGFRLSEGQYEAIQPNKQGWLWSQQLDLYLGLQGEQLRFFTSAKELVATPQEEATKQVQVAQAALQRAEQQQQRAERQQQRAERLAAKLQELGIDPTQV